jgi:RNA polymerase sigma factor (TIGR02999 family)
MGSQKKSNPSGGIDSHPIPLYLQARSGISDNREHAMLNELYEAAYEELRKMAASVKRRSSSSSVTLSPTAMLNEAYVKLANSRSLHLESILHLKCILARAMRYVLLSAARSRFPSLPAESGLPIFVTLTGLADTVRCDEQFVALHEALDELEGFHPRQAVVVEGRFFMGLTNAELAKQLQVGESTIERDWSAARAWLASKMRRIN